MRLMLTFLEGIISFLSPCMLPMLPVYISYFAGDSPRKGRTALRAGGFVLGFTVIFCLMGVFAGTVGGLLADYKTAVDLVCGVIVIIFGLSCLDVIRLPFRGIQKHRRADGFFPALLFGMVYSVNLTPCVGAFLGSALMLASSSQDKWQGFWLLLVYSLGMGVPFVLSALLLEQLKGFFGKIKQHYRILNFICGIFLIAVGILMSCGIFGKWIGRG